MSDLHKKLSNAFIQVVSYIQEGKEPQAFNLFERIINKEIEQLKANKYFNLASQYCRDTDELKQLLISTKETLTAYSNNDMMGMGADEAITAINKYLEQ